MRRIPPLSAVRVFEAAARHENFTSAAAELGMTQAAVSYQVKLLEERLGVPAVPPREKSESCSLRRHAGSRRRSAALSMRSSPPSPRSAPRTRRCWTVSTSNTFANTWLAWRLGSFQMGHPDMAVRLLTSDALADFATDDVDVAIRAGLGPWPEVSQDLLLQIDFTPMCSPGFLAATWPCFRAGRPSAPAADQPARQLVVLLAA